FANTLRRRQEGLRKDIHIEKSLAATIEHGGFPNIRFRRSSQPTEYLFLIDDQHRDSIQSRLFEYLVDFLQDKDVLAIGYFYRAQVHHVWSKQQKEKIPLRDLVRHYPNHRLVVLGDGHQWLSKQSEKIPSIDSHYTPWLLRWETRLFLSPMPPISWTFKEAGLYQVFALFPADIQGIHAAFDQLQNNEEEEFRKLAFKQWQRQLVEARPQEATVKYRRWKQFATLEDYLHGRPDLWIWLSALAVHPVVSWELTLAIGQALEVEGVRVNFDHLLLLSRIPWLQEGSFPSALRLELLAELDPAIERIARQTVKEELEVVEELTTNSFVNFELQTNLIIQNFLLEPEHPEYQEAIRSLTQGQQKIVDDDRYAELDQQIKKYQRAQGKTPQDLAVFLKQATHEQQQKSWINPWLKWAICTTVLMFFLGLSSLFLNNTSTLSELAFGSQNHNTPLRKAQENWWVKEHYIAPDDAIRLNNEAVDLFYSSLPELRFNDIRAKLDSAILLRKDSFPTAIYNLQKLYFNTAVQQYKAHFELLSNNQRVEADRALERAHQNFDQVIQH
ncbi:MAG: hypothetical protein AAGD05_17145, partial [Bacteroidota bacterium]